MAYFRQVHARLAQTAIVEEMAHNEARYCTMCHTLLTVRPLPPSLLVGTDQEKQKHGAALERVLSVADHRTLFFQFDRIVSLSRRVKQQLLLISNQWAPYRAVPEVFLQTLRVSPFLSLLIVHRLMRP